MGPSCAQARGKTWEEEARIIAQEFASYGLQACARPSDDLLGAQLVTLRGESDVRGMGKSGGWFCVTMPGRAPAMGRVCVPKMKYEDISHRYP
jgi:hypothetical protein